MTDYGGGGKEGLILRVSNTIMHTEMYDGLSEGDALSELGVKRSYSYITLYPYNISSLFPVRLDQSSIHIVFWFKDCI